MIRPSRRRVSNLATGDDPLALVPNLFDVALVLAMAFLVAALSIARQGDPGRTSRMEAGLRDAGQRLEQTNSERRSAGNGVRLGSAYRLESGEIIYVPE